MLLLYQLIDIGSRKYFESILSKKPIVLPDIQEEPVCACVTCVNQLNFKVPVLYPIPLTKKQDLKKLTRLMHVALAI